MNETEVVVDAQGLACPIPVLRVKKVLGEMESGRVVVIVDDPVAKENVMRLAGHLGGKPDCQPTSDGFRIVIDKITERTESR